MSSHAQAHIDLTKAIDSWLSRVGIQDSDTVASVAVDLADLVRAGDEVKQLVEHLVSLDATDSTDMQTALQAAAKVDVQLFTELKPHLLSLEKNWPAVLEKLDERAM